jgi:hypothetical protein
MSGSSEEHGDAARLCRSNDFIIAHASTRLYDSGDATINQNL